MSSYSQLAHPLLREPASSQEERLLADLDPRQLELDGRSTADWLHLLYEFARQVNHYNDRLQLSDWQPFFADSLPFVLARIHKLEVDQLAHNLDILHQLVRQEAQPENLQLYFDFIYEELLSPIRHWNHQFNGLNSGFGLLISNLIRADLVAVVRAYIALNNGAAHWYCIRRRDFNAWLPDPAWDLDLTDLYCQDTCFRDTPGGPAARIRAIADQLLELATTLLAALRELQQQAPNYLTEALHPTDEALQQQHAPHLGLLYTFLELYRPFQVNFNQLATRHLEFYYQRVLGIQPRPLRPDQAFLIFELQKHTAQKLLTAGTLFVGGRDDGGQDALYRLDQDVVIDKAQVVDLRTLYVKYINRQIVPDGFADPHALSGTEFVENVYAAPVATKADGQTIDFTENGASWPTLGAKASKYMLPAIPPHTEPQDYPRARQGWVLASPVLYLPEGQRHITITLTTRLDGSLLDEICGCDSDSFAEDLRTFLANDIFSDPVRASQLLRIRCSGAKEWLTLSPAQYGVTYTPSGNELKIGITITLDPATAGIDFYRADVLGEQLGTDLPLVVVELDTSQRVLFNVRAYPDQLASEPDSYCDLEHCYPNETVALSLYHYLRCLQVVDSQIDVEVCGVRDLLVQNDESIQDISGLVFPFGARPKVNAEFYIGSREIFLKNWEQMRISLRWKDLPDLNGYYAGYITPFEDGNNTISASSFRMWPAVLEAGEWRFYDPDGSLPTNDNLPLASQPQLFAPKVIAAGTSELCSWTNSGTSADQAVTFRHEFRRQEFPASSHTPGLLTTAPLAPLTPASRHGFVKVKLQGVSFQHHNYTNSLAFAMIEIAGGLNPFEVEELGDKIDEAIVKYGEIRAKALDIRDEINSLGGVLSSIEPLLNRPLPATGLLQLVDQLIVDINNAEPTPTLLARANTIRNRVNAILAQVNNPNPLIATDARSIMDRLDDHLTGANNLFSLLDELGRNAVNNADDGLLHQIKRLFNNNTGSDIIPNEPYTPTLKSVWLDYTASALADDIEFIHLYPYANTYKAEDLSQRPRLLPTFADEGTLYLGVDDLKPGSNLHLLFQLAEATADSESLAARLRWHYLRDNEWVPLREGFHLLDDGTAGLTRSGIVTLATPRDISQGPNNTVMPAGLHWLRVTARRHVAAVAETVGIHTQAARVTYWARPTNHRANLTLPANTISKLLQADSSIKAIQQPYPSFGGQAAEADNRLYQRISEQLRHRGRGITKYDYERLVLDHFPEVRQVRALNHSFALSALTHRRDLDIAPGFVTVVVIPDLDQLEGGRAYAPKAPVSLLTRIRQQLKPLVSPFTRLRVMNPRYERINVAGQVVLQRGQSVDFFQHQLRQDLRLFLSPWMRGQQDALQFGRTISLTELIQYIECLSYTDHITDLTIQHEEQVIDCYKTDYDRHQGEIAPLTARSILTAGDMTITALAWQCPEYADDCPPPLPPTTAHCRATNEPDRSSSTDPHTPPNPPIN